MTDTRYEEGDVDGEAETAVVDEDVNGLDDLPEVGPGERTRVLVVDRRLVGGVHGGSDRRTR